MTLVVVNQDVQVSSIVDVEKDEVVKTIFLSHGDGRPFAVEGEELSEETLDEAKVIAMTRWQEGIK